MTQPTTFDITLPRERASRFDSVYGGVQFENGVAVAELSPNARIFFLTIGADVHPVTADGSPLAKLTRQELREYAATLTPPIEITATLKAGIVAEIEDEIERRTTPAQGEPQEPVEAPVEPADEDGEPVPVVAVGAPTEPTAAPGA